MLEEEESVSQRGVGAWRAAGLLSSQSSAVLSLSAVPSSVAGFPAHRVRNWSVSQTDTA